MKMSGKPLGLHKRMKMGLNPVVAVPNPGSIPMMKKGGKVQHKKHGGHVDADCHYKEGGHVKKHHSAVSKHKGTHHGHHRMRSHGVKGKK